MSASSSRIQPSGLPHGVRASLQRRPLISFFVLAYGFSWLVSTPYILSVWGAVQSNWLTGFMLKQWVGPALAGMIMAGVIGGRPGLRDLRQKGRTWRVGWPWYLAILLGVPVLLLVGVLAVSGAPASPPRIGLELVGSYVLYFVLVFIAVGFPEEVGWRGFALPRLQARFGPLAGTLVLGLLWAGWHLPFFLTPDHGGGPQADPATVATNFALFSAMVVLMAVPFSFVFNRTRSVLMTALLHTAIDTPQAVWLPLLLPVGLKNSARGEARLDLALLLVVGVVAVLVVALTRGRLGWSATDPPARTVESDTTT